MHEITPQETYQLDSSDYDSDEEREALSEGEYDRLAEEGQCICPTSHSPSNSPRQPKMRSPKRSGRD